MERNDRSVRAHASGVGAARSGTTHFFAQRVSGLVSAVVLIGMAILGLMLAGEDYLGARQLLRSSVAMVLMILAAASITYHMAIGLRVIIQDYLHDTNWRLIAMIVNYLYCGLLFFVATTITLVLRFGD